MYASFDVVEALPPHPNKHPITPLNTIRCYTKTLFLSGHIPFVWLTLLVYVCVCVCPLMDTSRVCCEPGLCAGALTILMPSLSRWRQGEAGGFSAALSPLGAAGGKRVGFSAKMDDSFSIRAASVSTDMGGDTWRMASPVTWLGQKNMVGVTGGSEVSGAGMHQTCRSWKKLLFFFFLTHYCRKYRQTGIISTLDLLIHNRFFRIMWWYPHVHNSACFSGSADWLYKTRGRCQWTLWVLCYIKKENLQRVPDVSSAVGGRGGG